MSVMDYYGGEYGFIIAWDPFEPNANGESSSVSFRVMEKISTRVNQSSDLVPMTKEYLRGFIKWDSCSHFYFGENGAGYLHLCGREAIQKHQGLMMWLFTRAFEIMHREPED